MSLTNLQDWLWFSGTAGHAVLLVVLLARKRWQTFPIFVMMVAFQIVVAGGLYAAYRLGGKHLYAVAYWSTAAGDYGFQVAVVLELTRNVLRPSGGWISEARWRFLTKAVLGTLCSAAISLSLSSPQVTGARLWEMRISIFTSLLTCGLFFAMLTAANHLRLRIGAHAIAIASGLAIWASLSMIEDVINLFLGWRSMLQTCDEISQAIYVAVLIYWCIVFWVPEPSRRAG